MNHERAFRDYVTRVSFNLSMSRNQVSSLRQIVLNIESFDLSVPYSKRHAGWDERDERNRALREMGVSPTDHYVTGLRWLEANGLVKNTPGWEAEERKSKLAEKEGRRYFWNFDQRSLMLTPAGEHIVALLRIAGLIPMPAVNANAKRRRRAA